MTRSSKQRVRTLRIPDSAGFGLFRPRVDNVRFLGHMEGPLLFH